MTCNHFEEQLVHTRFSSGTRLPKIHALLGLAFVD